MNFVMKVKIIATIWADFAEISPNVIDADTIGDYKTELDAILHNEALNCIHIDGDYEEIEINSVEPYEDGIDVYGDILNKWQPEYEKRMNEITKA